MTPRFDEAQVSAWISNLFGETSGFINICSTGNWAGRNFRDRDQAVSYIKALDAHQPKGIYARATTLNQVPEAGSRGGVDHTSEFVGFWADLDVEGPGHKTDKPLPRDLEDCRAIIAASGLPQPTEWVASGGGYYPWWLLRVPLYLETPEAIAEVGLASALWQRVIELASQKLGFSYGAGVGDLARVLRIPGTVNRKVEDAPTMCEWLFEGFSPTAYEYTELREAVKASLLALEPPKPAAPAATFTAPSSGLSVPGSRPGDAFNAATTWPQLLEADGAQVFRDRGIGYTEWTRPGKDRRDGMSATTGYMGSDVLKVFTDSWPLLRQGETYDRFGYYAATQHNGNIREATKALSALGYGERPASMVKPTEFFYEKMAPWDDEVEASFSGADKPTVEQVVAGVSAKLHRYDFTEIGMADRLVDSYSGKIRFVTGRKQWLHYRDGAWVVDEMTSVFNLTSNLTTTLMNDADRSEDSEALLKALKPLRTASKIRGIEHSFSQRPGILTSADALDGVKHMVTVGNGVLNLTDGSFGPHSHKLLATKKISADFDPAATAPQWEKFLEDVLPDAEVRAYVQRAMGYTLTGEADQRAIFMLHGPSGTGKTQFLNAIGRIFGTFGKSADPGIFTMATNEAKSAASPGLHKLRGARLVTSTELPENMRIDEALVKRLTGMDVINSRDLYQSEESWTPEFAIWMATNFLPAMSSDDDAIWRRVKPIRFDQKFGTSDGKPEVYGIGEKLAREEASGILNWLLEGLRLYRVEGLGDTQAVREEVADYKAESDPVLRFVATAVAEAAVFMDADEKISANLLYSWFTAWCSEEGIRFPISQNRFGRRLSRAGYAPARGPGGQRMWAGLRAERGTWLVSGQSSSQQWRE